MKILLIFTLFICCFNISNAQWVTSGTTIYNQNTGNVGIGTNNPLAPLEVTSTAGGWLLNLRGNAITAGGVTGMKFFSGYIGENKWAGVSSVAESMHSNSTGLAFYAQMTEKMRITGSGNVGVGTANPISLFQVGDGIMKIAMGDASGAGMAYGTGYLGFNAARSGTNWTVLHDGANNGGAVIFSSIFGDIYFSSVETTGPYHRTMTDAEIKSRIKFRIAADGTSYAKSVNVQLTNWPDYVFKKNYYLPSLAEVQTYIDENNHLPEIPSAQQIAKDGLNLGEMNKLLLKKVEELTLYLIEKDKELFTQKEQLLSQQKQLNLQSEQIKTILEKIK